MHSLRDKKGTSVAYALREIFEQGRIPKRIRTDKGQEFRSKEVQSVLNNFGVIHLYAQNKTKAAVAERAIKTIKTKIYRYLTYQQSYRYTDKLQTFVKSYNNTYHRTIGMKVSTIRMKQLYGGECIGQKIKTSQIQNW